MEGGIDGLISHVDEAISVGIRKVEIDRNVRQRPSEYTQKLLSTFANVVHKVLF